MIPTPLVQRVAAAIRKVPLSISSTRRSGENGLRNAEELAAAVLEACHIEEMRELLRRISSYPDANTISDAHYIVRKQARDLLTKLGEPPLVSEATASSALLERMEWLAAALDCAIVFRQGMFHFIPTDEAPSDEILSLSVEMARQTVERKKP